MHYISDSGNRRNKGTEDQQLSDRKTAGGGLKINNTTISITSIIIRNCNDFSFDVHCRSGRDLIAVDARTPQSHLTSSNFGSANTSPCLGPTYHWFSSRFSSFYSRSSYHLCSIYVRLTYYSSSIISTSTHAWETLSFRWAISYCASAHLCSLLSSSLPLVQKYSINGILHLSSQMLLPFLQLLISRPPRTLGHQHLRGILPAVQR